MECPKAGVKGSAGKAKAARFDAQAPTLTKGRGLGEGTGKRKKLSETSSVKQAKESA